MPIVVYHLEQQSVCYIVHFILLQMRYIITSVKRQMHFVLNANSFFYFLFLVFADDDMQITGHLYTHLMHAVGLVVVLVHRAHRHVYKPSD